MRKITIKLDGMMCGMCEAHVNDAVRKACPAVKKVASSHAKGETVVLAEEGIDEEALCSSIQSEGYRVLSCRTEAYEKKGLFSFRKK